MKNSKSNTNVKISNPDKILYPEDKITKQDLVDYYSQICPWIMPYIINRPLAVVRCPNGYDNCFFQKHVNDYTPKAIRSIVIQEKEAKDKCIYINDKAGLLTLAQLAVLEIHPWGSTIKNVEYPDVIVFDLDPGPDVSWKKIVAAAFLVKQNLTDLKLKCFVRTTGGKGLHVVVPIKPEYEWDEIKNFTHVFADYIVSLNTKEFIGKMTKAHRKGKIYVDYLRNQRGATAIASYSTRARAHAPVAVPISWDELSNDRRDTNFTIKTVTERLEELKKDPWEKFFKMKQSLNIEKLINSLD